MARPNPYRPFTPDPEQRDLMPDISGNAINGLGETEPRRPRMVYWAPDTRDIPHGPLQEYFQRQSAREPGFAERRAKRQKLLDEPLPEVAATRLRREPQDWTDALTGFVEAGDCELTGVAEMRADWVYQGHSIDFARVVMLGVAHDHERLAAAPAPEAGLEVMTQYTRAAAVAKGVAGWIRA